MSHDIACDLCARSVAPHARYIVRMDIYADPTIPPFTDASMADVDAPSEMDALIQQMEHLSADDLQDQVHRRFEFTLCPSCHRQFLSNPLGLPRCRSVHSN